MKKKKKHLKWGRLFILLIAMILVLNLGNIARIIYPAKHTEHIKQYSAMYQVDPYLIMSIIKAESNFNATAVSQKNATGLMQIIKPTAMWLAERMELEDFQYEDIKDPELNIQMGCYYISYLLSLYDGNADTALAAYNAGEGTVDGWLANNEYSEDGKNLSYIPYPETRHYITKVNNNQKVYRALYKLSDSGQIIDSK
ncbi:MAG: lytic transglycosylase domain-containing protein [Ruminococcaceae bacterium]|nr:lytic transglycosylase domain-containing protein [Oscillospiraceae bacterium]